jgi:tRNA G18 (ribose-2'-O)-methylase SpoU
MKSPQTLSQNYDVVLVVYNIRSRHNVGSIFRTAESAKVKKIYLCGITPAPPHPKIDKVALGAQNLVPFEKCFSAIRVIKSLKKEGRKIISLEITKKSKNIFKTKFTGPLALIIGNEVKGIPSKILKLSDEVVFIPMFGKKESLNVSVAFGVAIYTILQNYFNLR